MYGRKLGQLALCDFLGLGENCNGTMVLYLLAHHWDMCFGGLLMIGFECGIKEAENANRILKQIHAYKSKKIRRLISSSGLSELSGRFIFSQPIVHCGSPGRVRL